MSRLETADRDEADFPIERYLDAQRDEAAIDRAYHLANMAAFARKIEADLHALLVGAPLA